MRSTVWDNGPLVDAGAFTLLRGDGPVAATINLGNSIIGTVANGGGNVPVHFNSTAATLAVGQTTSNRVTVLTLDLIFRDGFD